MKSDIIRKTSSICNVCLKRIEAEVFEKKGEIRIKKRCNKHGKSESAHVWDDPETYRFLLNFKKFKFPSRKVLLNLTNDCNLNCRFCYAKSNEFPLKDISLLDIKAMDLAKFDYIFLSGGEPTIKDDLCEIIKYLKKKKKTVFLLTNGIKLEDKAYAKEIKQTGIDMVILQFDSLCEEDIKYLRNKPLLNKKLNIIKNLHEFNMPVYFFSIQLKKNNLKNMSELVDYFKRYKKIIKGINFNTIWRIGRHDDQEWMSTGDIMKNSCKILGVTKKDYLISTEFMYYTFILISMMKNKRRYFSRCLTFLPVIFDKDKTIPITEIFNLERITKYLKEITIEGKKIKILNLFLYLLFSQIIKNSFDNKNFRLLIYQTIKKLKYIAHMNKFLLNPFTTFNVGEFPTAEDFDYDFVDTCNLYYHSPDKKQNIPVCLNQIKFSRSQHPLQDSKKKRMKSKK